MSDHYFHDVMMEDDSYDFFYDYCEEHPEIMRSAYSERCCLFRNNGPKLYLEVDDCTAISSLDLSSEEDSNDQVDSDLTTYDGNVSFDQVLFKSPLSHDHMESTLIERLYRHTFECGDDTFRSFFPSFNFHAVFNGPRCVSYRYFEEKIIGDFTSTYYFLPVSWNQCYSSRSMACTRYDYDGIASFISSAPIASQCNAFDLDKMAYFRFTTLPFSSLQSQCLKILIKNECESELPPGLNVSLDQFDLLIYFVKKFQDMVKSNQDNDDSIYVPFKLSPFIYDFLVRSFCSLQRYSFVRRGEMVDDVTSQCDLHGYKNYSGPSRTRNDIIAMCPVQSVDDVVDVRNHSCLSKDIYSLGVGIEDKCCYSFKSVHSDLLEKHCIELREWENFGMTLSRFDGSEYKNLLLNFYRMCVSGYLHGTLTQQQRKDYQCRYRAIIKHFVRNNRSGVIANFSELFCLPPFLNSLNSAALLTEQNHLLMYLLNRVDNVPRTDTRSGTYANVVDAQCRFDEDVDCFDRTYVPVEGVFDDISKLSKTLTTESQDFSSFVSSFKTFSDKMPSGGELDHMLARITDLVDTIKPSLDVLTRTMGEGVDKFSNIAADVLKFKEDAISITIFLLIISIVSSLGYKKISLISLILLLLSRLPIFGTLQKAWHFVCSKKDCEELETVPIEGFDVLEAHYLPIISRFILTFLYISVLKMYPAKDGIDGFMRRIANVPRAIDGFGKMQEYFTKIFDFALEEVKIKYGCLQDNARMSDYSMFTRLNKWVKSSTEVLQRPNSDRTDIILLKKYNEDIGRCYAEGLDLYQMHFSVSNKSLIQSYLTKLEKIKHSLIIEPVGGGPRLEPFTIYFQGDSGVGKSQLLNHLMPIILKSLNIPKEKQNMSNVYTQNPRKKFVDGYRAQDVFVCDEAFCGVDSEQVPNEEYQNVLSYCNNFAFMLDGAALDEKNNFFVSKVLVYNGNTRRIYDKIKSLWNPEAICRRLNGGIVVRVLIKPEYRRYISKAEHRDPENKLHATFHTLDSKRCQYILPPSKIPWDDYAASEPLPSEDVLAGCEKLSFKKLDGTVDDAIRKFNPHVYFFQLYDIVTEKKKGKPLDYFDFCKFMSDEIKAHEASGYDMLSELPRKFEQPLENLLDREERYVPVQSIDDSLAERFLNGSEADKEKILSELSVDEIDELLNYKFQSPVSSVKIDRVQMYKDNLAKSILSIQAWLKEIWNKTPWFSVLQTATAVMGLAGAIYNIIQSRKILSLDFASNAQGESGTSSNTSKGAVKVTYKVASADASADSLVSMTLPRNTYSLLIPGDDGPRFQTNVLMISHKMMLMNYHIFSKIRSYHREGLLKDDDIIKLIRPLVDRELSNVASTMCFTVKHLLDAGNHTFLDNEYNNDRTYYFNDKPYVLKGHKDAVLVYMHGKGVKGATVCGDVIKHFIKREDLIHVTRNENMWLVTNRYKPDSHVVSHIPLQMKFVYNLVKDPMSDLISKGCYKTGVEYFLLRSRYEYNGMTQRGDCGGAVVICNSGLTGKIIGIHAAGETYAHERCVGSSAVAISREDLEEAIAKIPNCVSAGIRDERREAIVVPVENGNLPSPNFDLLGYLRNPETGEVQSLPCPQQTKWIPSVFERNRGMMPGLFEKRKCPAKLHVSKDDDPLLKGLKKCDGGSFFIDPHFLQVAGHDVLQQIIASQDRGGWIKPVNPILTFEESVQGVEGNDYIRSINAKSSPGFPYCLQKRPNGKRYWVGEDLQLDGPGINELRDDVETMKEVCKTEIPYVVFIDTLKDETRDMENGLPKKTRVFSAGPMHFIVLFRQYFAQFAAAMMSGRIENSSGVGINPYSMEWHKLATLLTAKGPCATGIDFVNYDGSLNIQILEYLIELINSWYTFTFGENKEHNTIRMNLFMCLSRSIHLCRNTFYVWLRSQPSGNPFTTIINTVYTLIVVRLAFLYQVPEDLWDLKIFNLLVYLAAYGDDLVINYAKQFHQYFRFENLRRALVTLGHDIKEESKTDVVHEFRTLSEVRFLKRAFEYDDLNARYLGPLLDSTIEEMILWVQKGKNLGKKTADNLNFALMEASLHPKQYYNSFVNVVYPGLSLLDPLDLFPLLPWWQQREVVLKENFNLI